LLLMSLKEKEEADALPCARRVLVPEEGKKKDIKKGGKGIQFFFSSMLAGTHGKEGKRGK